MKISRKFLTGILIGFIAVCSTNMFAGEGLQYVKAYNEILKGIQDRGGLPTVSPKPYAKTSTVTQSDLNTLRDAVWNIACNYVVYNPWVSEGQDDGYHPDTNGEDKLPFEKVAELTKDENNNDVYIFRVSNREKDAEGKETGKAIVTGKSFTKVPGQYTKFGTTIYGKYSLNFNCPIMWIHFQEIAELLNQCIYKYDSDTDYILGRTYYGDGASGYHCNPPYPPYEPASIDFDPTQWLHDYRRIDYRQGLKMWFIYYNYGTDHSWYVNHFVYKLNELPNVSNYNPERGDILEFFHRSRKETWYNGTYTLEYCPWISELSPEINTEYSIATIFLADLGYYIPEGTTNCTLANVMEKKFFLIKQKIKPVSISDPSKIMDSSANGVVVAGCIPCQLAEAFEKEFSKNKMATKFLLGMSTGFDSGLIVYSYLTNYEIGEFRFTHHNLNTSIVRDYPSTGYGTEPDGNQWKFTLVQRPKGAQVLMGWINWTADTPELAEPTSGGGYKLKERPRRTDPTAKERIIEDFSDKVVHVFSGSSGAGTLSSCEQVVEDELLTVTHPGSGLSGAAGAKPVTVNSWGVVTASPTYDTEDICTAVYYTVGGLQWAKVTVEYGWQIAARNNSNVYYVADASNLIDYSLFAVESPLGQSTPVTRYCYYKYIDGAYVLQSETRTSFDENGNPASEDFNVENGASTTVAKGTSFTTLDSEDPSVTISQKTVTEGTNTFITIEKTKAYPWGNEVIEEIEGYGSADEKTTTYTYYIDDTEDGYGKVKSVSYPDGTWVRYEYNSDGLESKVIRPIGNIATTAAENLCRVTEYDYNAYVTGDTVSAGDTRPRMTVEKELGVEMSRSYQGFMPNEYVNIRCQTAGATWNAADNLVTHKYSYTTGDFSGRHWKQVNPDGTMNITSYAKTATEFTTTVERGTGSGSTVSDGVRSISVMNTKGWTTSSQTIDIASGLTLSNATYTHDDTGRVIRTDYADGTYTTTTYACCGPSQQVNREGTATDIMYDTLKRVINRETDGIATLYTYDANDRVLTSTVKGNQGAEKTITNAYNTAGELVSTTSSDGQTTTYSESWVNNVRYSTTTLPNGKTQITKYNLDGTPAESYGTAVRHVKYEYGIENGERYTKTIMVGENDSEALWTKSYTNFAGQNYKTVNSAGATVLTEYDNLGRPIKQTAPNGVVSLTEYNAKGEAYVSAIDMNQNGVIDYGGTDRINKNENLYESKSGKVVSKRTASVYATDGTATATVASVSEGAVDGSASWQTSFGNTTQSQTVLGGSGAKTITVTNPDNSTVTTVYVNGRMTSSTHSVLGVTTYTYDEFNRVSTVTHPEGGVDKVSTYTYNPAGQVATITIVSGSSSRETSYAYNNMGARTSVTLPGGRVVNYTYTDTGELATVSGSDTYPQAYTYDALGKMKTLTTYKAYPGTPEVTTWNYALASGFMTSKVYDDGNGTNYTYNPGGQLLTRVWDRGITTTYAYDNAGAQNSIDYSDTTPDITFSYDRLGRIKTVADVSGTRTNTYDANLRLESSTIPHILDTKLDYAYDTLGRMSSMKLMENTTEKLINSYTYDAMSRIATVGDGTNTAEYIRLAGTNLLNSVVIKQGATTKLSTTKTYDAFNRLLSTSSISGATTRTYSYEYNDKDQRTKLTLADGSYWTYSYDDKGQVTSGIKYNAEDRPLPGQSFNYTFDDIGNRLTEKKGMPEMLFNYTANNVNQYTQRTVPGIVPITGSAATDAKVTVKDTDSEQVYTTTRDGKYFSKAVAVSNSTSSKEMNLEVNAVKFDASEDKDIVKTISGKYFVAKTPQAFTYDTDGNMTSDGNGWNYTWNGENRMIEAYNDTVGKKLECAYDFMGRRISKKVYTGTSGTTWTLSTSQKFVYNGFKQIAEYDVNDNLQKTYTHTNVPLWMKDGTNYYFYIVDGNKNVRAMIDVSGNEVANYDYNPFGKIVVNSGSYKDTNKYRFSSEYHDDEMGLIYYNFRYYDTELGRWTNRDPIEETGGYNLYRMVNNDPINHIDDLGLLRRGEKRWYKGNKFDATTAYLALQIQRTLHSAMLNVQTDKCSPKSKFMLLKAIAYLAHKGKLLDDLLEHTIKTGVGAALPGGAYAVAGYELYEDVRDNGITPKTFISSMAIILKKAKVGTPGEDLTKLTGKVYDKLQAKAASGSGGATIMERDGKVLSEATIGLAWSVNLLGQGEVRLSGYYKRSVGGSVCCRTDLTFWSKWKFSMSYSGSKSAIKILENTRRGYLTNPR